MNLATIPFFAFTLVTVLMMQTSNAGESKTTPVKEVATWEGMVADRALLSHKTDFITASTAWETVWTAWRPQEDAPKIDFADHLVLVGTVPGPNHVIFNAQIDSEGHVKLMTGGTRRGGPGFGYRFVQIARAGVQSINGDPVAGEPNPSTPQVKVDITGTLKTGIMAIGGETTGITMTSGEITWEVELSSDEQAASAEQLHGAIVRVTGTLRRVDGCRGS